MLSIYSKITRPVRQAPLLFMRNMIKFPDRSQFRFVKRIGMMRIIHLMFTSDCRFPISNHSFPRSAFRSDNRPFILPFHRIQHQTPPHIIAILKSVCPGFSFSRFYISALMNTCTGIINIIIYQNFRFIRPVKVP